MLIFALTLFITSICSVNAEVGVNLTKDLTDENGNSLPTLNLAASISTTQGLNGSSNSNSITYFDYTEERNYHFIVCRDSGNTLTVYLLADRFKMYSDTYNDLTLNDNRFYIYNMSNSYNYYSISPFYYIYSKKNNESVSKFNYSGIFKPFFKFSWNGSAWNVQNNVEYSILKNSNIIYSTDDIYFLTDPDNLATGSLYNTGTAYTTVPSTDDMQSIQLDDAYSVVFKPKYSNITSNSDLKFIFQSSTINSYKWYQNYQLFQESTFSSEWVKQNISYSSLDLEYNTDTIEFVRAEYSDNTHESDSGFQHGGGGRHLDYDEETNSLIESFIKTGYIYYYSNYFDYCIKYYDNSQCYAADGTIDNSYFTNADSTNDYINNLISYFGEQNNYFVAFGALIKYTFFALPGEIRTFIIAVVIMFLIYGFTGLIRRK